MRKPLQHDRRKSDAWFKALVELMHEGVAVIDEDERIAYANPRFCEITAYSLEELIGHPLIAVLRTDKAAISKHLRAWRQGKNALFEIDARTKDGQLLALQISIRPLYIEEQPRSCLLVLTDVTEYKLVDQKIRILSEVVEQSPIGVLITDRIGIIKYVNRRLCEISGYSADELVGHSPRVLQSGQTPTAVYRSLWSAIRKNREWRGELLDRKKNGELYWTYLVVSYLRNPQGKVTHCIGLIEDITARKQAEDALQKSATQLRLLSEKLILAQEEERKRIAMELHDNIGQYLHIIKISLQQADVESDHTVRLIPLVQEAIDELRQVSMDLRPPMLDDLGILATIDWFCRRLQNFHPELNIAKEINLEEHDVQEPLKLTLFRILQEALTNAAKHAHARQVVIWLAKNRGQIELRIEDDGIGFEVAKTLATDTPPRGLGLLDMRERTLLSGGDFAVESSPGKGTKVYACWPLSKNVTSGPCLAEDRHSKFQSTGNQL